MNEVNDMDNDQIAAALERLTQPVANATGEPALYKKALESRARTLKFVPLMRKPAVKIGVAAMLVLAAGSAWMTWRTMERGETGRSPMYGYAGKPIAPGSPATDYSNAPEFDLNGVLKGDQDRGNWREKADAEHKMPEYRKTGGDATSGPATASVSDRQVVRKAVMELQIADVRAGYMKALMLASEASGEFVQESALAGGDPPTSANLTLRVTTARLSTVLQQLRELGKVTSETSTGEDVTDRLVDLGARLRNEERVEREMLDLLEKRKDSQLKDVLDVRDRLGQVRGVIEQLRAQQAAAEKSVALATILVVIRAAPEAPKPPPPIAGFGEKLQIAAMDGLHSAGDSVIGLSRGAIAGLPWWTGLTLCGFGVVALRRRMLKQAAREPAPAV